MKSHRGPLLVLFALSAAGVFAQVAPASASSDSRPDTTVAVSPGSTLEIENFGGAISITTWDKNAIRIEVDRSVGEQVTIERAGSTIALKPRTRRWVPGVVNFQITAPRWIKLDLSGVNTSIDVENCEAEVHAETVNGDVTARGGQGPYSLSSVQGEVRVQGARGRVDASSVNEGVQLEEISGPIVAESVNGGIVIKRSRSESIEASTLSGPVRFEGDLAKSGSYRFTTHNGCIDVVMPEHADATVSLSTFSGGIDSSFPVTLKKLEAKRFRTVFGSGTAKLDLESFQGTIFLRRPNEAGSDCFSDEDAKELRKEMRKELHLKVHKDVKDLKDLKEKDKDRDKDDEEKDSGDEGDEEE